MAHRNRRRGMKAIEVVVVVLILFMVAALLLPSVGSRPAGRRTTCMNNMRNLGLAMQDYDNRKGQLPGYRGLMVGDPDVHPQAGAAIPASWVFSILPGLEQLQISIDVSDQSEVLDFAKLGYANAADPRRSMPQLNILICPSDTRNADKTSVLPYRSRPVTSYVANCGQPDSVEARQRLEPGDALANGVFQDGLAYAWSNGQVQRNSEGQPIRVTPPSQSISRIQAGDGTSATVMFSENMDAGFWPEPEEWNIGFVWVPRVEASKRLPFDGATHVLRPINRDAGQVDDVCGPALGSPLVDAQRYAFARPSSAHPGGVNVIFCDAHTSFISDRVDYVVWCLLMTPKGRAAEDVQRYYGQCLTDDPDPDNDVFATRKLDESEYQ